MLGNSQFNVMTVVILAVFVLFAFHGFKKGMVSKLSGIIALVISAMLVSFFLPTVTQFIKERTPVYSLIEQQCEKTVSTLVADTLMGDGSGQSSSLDRDQIRSLMDAYGMDSSQLDALSDNEVLKIVEQYFQDYLPQAGESASAALDSLTKNEQTRLIQELPVPDFLKNLILTYNNSDGYQKMDAPDFGSYLIHFFANVILNIVSFLVTLMVVQLIVWLILRALGIFARLPFLRVVNHLGGLLVGILQGLFAVWMIFLLISMLSGTGIGMKMMSMIDASSILKPLYQSNLFLKIVTGAISRIM